MKGSVEMKTLKYKQKSKKTRLNYKRTAMAIIVILAVLVFAVTVNSEKDIPKRKITVQHGDTLWDISKKYKARNEDTRAYIYKIKKVNNISNLIYPGDEIILP